MIPVSSSHSSSPGLDDDDDELLSVFYNQEYDCFSAGTSSGFRIYNFDPFGETFRRDVRSTGGFKIVEMLFRSNILALVGSSSNSHYSPNKVLIWDDHQSRCIGEFSFRSEICGVKLRRDRIVIVLEHRIYIYSFTDLKLLHSIETLANPKGLCCLSQQPNTSVLACPGVQRGHVRVEHFGLDVVKMIKAHESHIAFLTLTMDGLLLSTASSRGTLIRIFNTLDGGCLQEVRRGGEKAEIYGIAFSKDVQWLAVSSNKGTVHVFSLRVRVASEDSYSDHSGHLLNHYSSSSIDVLTPTVSPINPQSSLPFMKGVLPKYFNSERSFAQFHLKEEIPFLACFGPHNNVVIVGLNGSFYRCSFDVVNGGEMKQVEYVRFMKGSGNFRL